MYTERISITRHGDFIPAVISALATALIVASLLLLRKHPNDGIGEVASWTFMTVTFLVPLLGFGVFEGVYNHALKVALYFAHASPVLMAGLFPPQTYEMPNNAFLEVTGVMQVIPGFVTGYYLYRFVRERNEPTDATTIHRYTQSESWSVLPVLYNPAPCASAASAP